MAPMRKLHIAVCLMTISYEPLDIYMRKFADGLLYPMYNTCLKYMLTIKQCKYILVKIMYEIDPVY
jgi:hypothetical protein